MQDVSFLLLDALFTISIEILPNLLRPSFYDKLLSAASTRSVPIVLPQNGIGRESLFFLRFFLLDSDKEDENDADLGSS